MLTRRPVKWVDWRNLFCTLILTFKVRTRQPVNCEQLSEGIQQDPNHISWRTSCMDEGVFKKKGSTPCGSLVVWTSGLLERHQESSQDMRPAQTPSTLQEASPITRHSRGCCYLWQLAGCVPHHREWLTTQPSPSSQHSSPSSLSAAELPSNTIFLGETTGNWELTEEQRPLNPVLRKKTAENCPILVMYDDRS